MLSSQCFFLECFSRHSQRNLPRLSLTEGDLEFALLSNHLPIHHLSQIPRGCQESTPCWFYPSRQLGVLPCPPILIPSSFIPTPSLPDYLTPASQSPCREEVPCVLSGALLSMMLSPWGVQLHGQCQAHSSVLAASLDSIEKPHEGCLGAPLPLSLPSLSSAL